MRSFVIKKKKSKKKIVTFPYKEEGLVLHPNIHKENMVTMNKINISDHYAKTIALKKVDKMLKRLESITYSVLDSEDTTSGDIIIALDEIARIKGIILKKYYKYLKQEEVEKQLTFLKELETGLKVKVMEFKEEKELEEEKSHSR